MPYGDNVIWVDELRYLGVYIVRSRVFKCSRNEANLSIGSPIQYLGNSELSKKSYSDRLKALKLPTLKYRRYRGIDAIVET